MTRKKSIGPSASSGMDCTASGTYTNKDAQVMRSADILKGKENRIAISFDFSWFMPMILSEDGSSAHPSIGCAGRIDFFQRLGSFCSHPRMALLHRLGPRGNRG